jgi:hypothetical protein
VRYFLAALFLSFLAGTALAQSILPFSLPLYFEADQNQSGFVSRGSGYQFQISPQGVQLALSDSGTTAAAQMQFVGANSQAEISGADEMSGRINYLIGSDSSHWQTGLPTFSRVQIAQLYPGIDLVFHGNQRQLEYDFTVAPGARTGLIQFRFSGVDKISLTPEGDLLVKIGAAEIIQPRPEIYQTIAGTRKDVSGGYKILDARTVAFTVGAYDHSRPLVIDPVISYSSFFGSNGGTFAYVIALNTNTFPDSTNGYIYIAGQTVARKFYTVGAYQTNYGGGHFNGDAFVAKFTNPATNLLYLTYLGGTNEDAAYGLAVDPAGDAFIGGFTDSPNFPTYPTNTVIPHIPSAFNPSYGIYPESGFVAELNTNGSQLVFSTYLGGSYQDIVDGIALDSSNDLYAVGYTSSTNFPVWPRGGPVLQSSLLCSNNGVLNFNGFVTEIAPGGTNFVYSTYLGGTNKDFATCVTVDANNSVYVAGYTDSTNFPVWNKSLDAAVSLTNFPVLSHLNGDTNFGRNVAFDAFVTKFPAPLTSVGTIHDLTYSTYLGGTNNDEAYGIAADAAGNAYVTGWTVSTNFPDTFPTNTLNPSGLHSFLTTNGILTPFGVTNAFLTKVSPDGSEIINSIVFGGNGQDIGYGVAVDSAGNAFVVGRETSTNFPTANTFDTLSATNSRGQDAFVASFNPAWTAMNYSVLIGGRHDDAGYGIALDPSDNAFITGSTDSTNFPIQSAPFPFTVNDIGTNFFINGTNFINGNFRAGTNDAFLTEIQFSPPAPTNIVVTPAITNVGVGASVTFSITGDGQGTPVLLQWQHQGFTNVVTTTTNVTITSTNIVRTTNVETVFTNIFNRPPYSGVTSTALTITNIQFDDATNYQVIIYYGGPPLVTNVVLDVEQQPVIVDAPVDVTNAVGGDATFTVTAFGQPPLHYQWQFDGTNLVKGTHVTGVTTNTLTLTDITTNEEGTYDIIVSNSFGLTTNSAELVVVAAPLLLTSLTNEYAGLGSTVDFAVSAFGATPFHYIWYKNGVTLTNKADGGRISGATNDTLILTGATTNDDGTYEVTVTNTFGVTNSSATLTVLTVPMFTGIFPISGSFTNGMKIYAVGVSNTASCRVYATTNLQLTPIGLTWSNLTTITNVQSPGNIFITLSPANIQEFVPYLANWPQVFFTIVQSNTIP